MVAYSLSLGRKWIKKWSFLGDEEIKGRNKTKKARNRMLPSRDCKAWPSLV